jgi:hypothetical protein
MKKILIFLFLVYSYSFSDTCYYGSVASYTGATAYLKQSDPHYVGHSVSSSNVWTYYVWQRNSYTCGTTPPPSSNCINGTFTNGQGIVYNCENGQVYLENSTYNPETGETSCNSGYSMTGTSLGIPACMPNPENGTWDDNDDLVCNEGYAKNNDNNTCELSSGNNTGGVDTNPNNTWKKALDEAKANGSYSVSNNGTQNFTVGGNNYSLTSDGILTTTYPDGTSSVQQVDFSNGGSSTGGTGSTGGGSGTSGGNSGNTTNENNTTPPTDTPIDNTPVANSCNDSNLTLQEKMLCELNAGMKKQNSEGSPQNSLNQLLKDLKTSNQTDNTALNTNIKEGNKILEGLKSLSENQLNKQTQANATLEKINDSANATELYTKVMNESMNKIIGDDSTETPDLSDLKDSSSWINGVLDEYKTFYNNLKDSGNSFTTFANGAKDTIEQGFTLNLSSSQMVNCPLDYVIDLSSMGQESININVDFCEQTSKLRPYLYPFILIILFISIIFFTISFVRGL